MKYERAKHLKSAEFKRFWGVKPETFEQMVEIVSQHEGQKKKSGRPGKTSLEDQVLMTLEYWRVGSHLFPYGSILGSDGIYGLSNYSENRKNFKSIKSFHSVSLNQAIECLVDKGYQGIQKLHANSQIPKKKPKVAGN